VCSTPTPAVGVAAARCSFRPGGSTAYAARLASLPLRAGSPGTSGRRQGNPEFNFFRGTPAPEEFLPLGLVHFLPVHIKPGTTTASNIDTDRLHATPSRKRSDRDLPAMLASGRTGPQLDLRRP